MAIMDFSALKVKRTNKAPEVKTTTQNISEPVDEIIPEQELDSHEVSVVSEASVNVVKVQMPHLDKTVVLQNVVDSLFVSYKLSSLLTSYFGGMLSSYVPSGYVIEEYGALKFLVKKQNGCTPITMTDLARNIISTVDEIGKAQVPLAVTVEYTDDSFSMLLFTKSEIAALLAYRPDLTVTVTSINAGKNVSDYSLIFSRKE